MKTDRGCSCHPPSQRLSPASPCTSYLNDGERYKFRLPYPLLDQKHEFRQSRWFTILLINFHRLPSNDLDQIGPGVAAHLVWTHMLINEQSSAGSVRFRTRALEPDGKIIDGIFVLQQSPQPVSAADWNRSLYHFLNVSERDTLQISAIYKASGRDMVTMCHIPPNPSPRSASSNRPSKFYKVVLLTEKNLLVLYARPLACCSISRRVPRRDDGGIFVPRPSSFRVVLLGLSCWHMAGIRNTNLRFHSQVCAPAFHRKQGTGVRTRYSRRMAKRPKLAISLRMAQMQSAQPGPYPDEHAPLSRHTLSGSTDCSERL